MILIREFYKFNPCINNLLRSTVSNYKKLKLTIFGKLLLDRSLISKVLIEGLFRLLSSLMRVKWVVSIGFG